VLPVPTAARAADLCALAGVSADVVPVLPAGIAALPVAGGTASPGSGVPAGAWGVDAAERLSRLLRGLDVVLLLAGEDQVSAQRWAGGARGEDPRAGLLLATWPDDVQRLLLGRLDPADVEGSATSAGRGRWSAFRSLLRRR
jgi:hypothetical protein